MDPTFLTLSEILDIHADQLRRYGGSPGIRDHGLLDSALAMPSSAFGEHFYHADLYAMGSAYLFHIVMNHPFIDGNKRCGFAACYVFLRINNIQLQTTNDDAVNLVLETAQGRMDKTAIAQFLKKHSRKTHH